MRYAILLILANLLCIQCYAQEITSVTDTINGSSFGIKNPAAPIKWETFEDGAKDADWTYEFGDNQKNSISIIQTGNRVGSLYNAECDLYTRNYAYFSWIDDVSAQSKIYMYYWVRKNFIWSDSPDDAWGKVKVNRVTA
jgi:hypothetical protein